MLMYLRFGLQPIGLVFFQFKALLRVAAAASTP
jgi:hypothetical protein